MSKGKFGLLYIDEQGKVYPAYPKIKEYRRIVNDLIAGGLFGDEIMVDKENQLGVIKEEANNAKDE